MHANALNLKRAVRCDTVNGEPPLGNCAATTLTSTDLPQEGRKYGTPLPVKNTRFA